MFYGFYNLASGMATQNRNLNVISNNMVNVTTPGFKSDTLTSTTFGETFYRTGNQNRNESVEIGAVNRVRVPEQTITDYTQGNYVETGNKLHFAIDGAGFFKVETPDGNEVYTRNGSFYIDEDNALALKGVGKVMGTAGEITFENDEYSVSPTGGIYDSEGSLIDDLLVVDFENYEAMEKSNNGIFTSGGEELEVENPHIMNGMVEQSNVNAVQEMVDMMSSQRTLQSAAQVLKMYDEIMSKASSDIGRM